MLRNFLPKLMGRIRKYNDVDEGDEGDKDDIYRIGDQCNPSERKQIVMGEQLTKMSHLSVLFLACRQGQAEGCPSQKTRPP